MKKTTSNLFSCLTCSGFSSLFLAPVVMIIWKSFFNIEGQFTLEKLPDLLHIAELDLSQDESEFGSLCRDYNCRNPADFLPDCILFDSAQAQAALADADCPADLDQSPAQSLCFHWYFWSEWLNQSISDFYRSRTAADSLYRLFIIFVASYIELPFMILPIFNVLDDLDPNLINASYDLGANRWETFRRVVFPLSLNGVRSGVQSVFIPSLSLFMLTRLIGGNRVITLGTAIEQHFLTTQNWGMGSTIGVVLIVAMLFTMWATKERRGR